MQYKVSEFVNGEEVSCPTAEMSGLMDSELPGLEAPSRWYWIALIAAPIFALSMLRGKRPVS